MYEVKRSKLFVYMDLYIVRDIGSGKVILIFSERVLYFFRYQFKTGYHIEDKAGDGHHQVAHAEDISQRECNGIGEDEFLYKDRIGKRDGGILDPFTGAADLGERLELGVEDDELGIVDDAGAV